MPKKILSGNEAVAYAALESEVHVVTGYPGTPSTQIIETILESIQTNDGSSSSSQGRFPYVEWSVNEKVAVEVAGAASLSNLRSMCVMKNVGLNVALDFLMTLNLTGTKSGMIIVSVDDIGAKVSQNEEDSRRIGQVAHLPVLEPIDAVEALKMTKQAFILSERIGLPFMIRMTQDVSLGLQDVYVSHHKGNSQRRGEFKRQHEKLFLVGSSVQASHNGLHRKLVETEQLFEKSRFCWVDRASNGKCGIITSGYLYLRVKEVLKDLRIENKVSILKIGTPFPLPRKKIVDFASDCHKLLILEEIEPVIEEQVKRILFDAEADVRVTGRNDLSVPYSGPIFISSVRSIICDWLDLKIERNARQSQAFKFPQLRSRAVTFCIGCPHRAAFYALRKALQHIKVKYIDTSDIGCYGIGAFHPFYMGDTNMCMGSSVGLASGLAHSNIEDTLIVASIGDSTFFHSGMPALVNAIHNRANVLVVIHDNEAVGMTGGQPTPSFGKNCMDTATKKISIEEVCRAFGVESVKVLDAFSIEENIGIIKEVVESERFPSVVVFKGGCPLIVRSKYSRKPIVDQTLCSQCLICMTDFGCPAIQRENDNIFIAENVCTSCCACFDVCPLGAIVLRSLSKPS